MENINKKTLIVGSAAIILIAIFIAYSLFSRSARQTGLGGGTAKKLTESGVAPERQGPFPTITKEEIKPTEKIIVPEINSTTTADVAIPLTVQAAAPGVSNKDRAFNLKAEKGVFIPSTIIVNTGDTVRINFTAVDKTYDFFLGDQYGVITQPIAKGQTALPIVFQAWATGKFTFYCRLCGGLDSTTVGQFIVL